MSATSSDANYRWARRMNFALKTVWAKCSAHAIAKLSSTQKLCVIEYIAKAGVADISLRCATRIYELDQVKRCHMNHGHVVGS